MRRSLEIYFDEGMEIKLLLDDGEGGDEVKEVINGDAFKPSSCMIFFNQLMMDYKQFEENMDLSPIIWKMKNEIKSPDEIRVRYENE